MIVRQADSTPGQEVDLDGAQGVIFRMLLGGPQGAPNFFMRQFNVTPGGNTPYHSHPWEHEVYVLAGSGVVKSTDGQTAFNAGDCLIILPGEEHQFINTAPDELKFLCIVPASSDK